MMRFYPVRKKDAPEASSRALKSQLNNLLRESALSQPLGARLVYSPQSRVPPTIDLNVNFNNVDNTISSRRITLNIPKSLTLSRQCGPLVISQLRSQESRKTNFKPKFPLSHETFAPELVPQPGVADSPNCRTHRFGIPVDETHGNPGTRAFIGDISLHNTGFGVTVAVASRVQSLVGF